MMSRFDSYSLFCCSSNFNGLVLFSQDQIGKLEGTLKGLLMFILLASYGYFGYLHDIVISQKKYDSVVKVEKRYFRAIY